MSNGRPPFHTATGLISFLTLRVWDWQSSRSISVSIIFNTVMSACCPTVRLPITCDWLIAWAGVAVAAFIMSVMDIPKWKNLDITIGRSYAGPFWLPVCKSLPMISGQNSFFAHISVTVQLKAPCPCPTSNNTPLLLASTTSGWMVPVLASIILLVYPWYVWV